MRNAVERALMPFNDGVRFDISGPQVTLSTTVSGALMMALHELATNAVKYGALSNLDGHLSIRWSIEADKLVFTWHEPGGPEVEVPKRRGFGTKMIERVLSATVRGKAKIDYLPGGVVFTLESRLQDVRYVRLRNGSGLCLSGEISCR